MASGELKTLSKKHVDTGMGLERLAMVLQGKKSNYDTDIFHSLIEKIEQISGLRYKPENENEHKQAKIINTAMRVIADHIRAIAFAIADGQLPSNTGAGYVIRRILRRAIRYGYQSLELKEPFLHRLIPTLRHLMGDHYPELKNQQGMIEKVIKEEEISFFRTLEQGLKKIDQICIRIRYKNEIKVSGKDVFDLYDTYGFPVDLTSLIARGYGLEIDEKEFQDELQKQKDRSRKAAAVETSDWVVIKQDDKEEFIGYDRTDTNVHITRYRKVKSKGKELYHLVFNITPFYAEGGGQVGDTGFIKSETEEIEIKNTFKENKLIIHLAEKQPKDPGALFHAQVDLERRKSIAKNHTATHLLHQALREVLGDHVEQKGSLVHPDYLRFDFSHFSKVTEEEIKKIEKLVNLRIRENFPLEEKREVPMQEGLDLGAIALFGEKYGDLVRVIKFGESIEFCGGIHATYTGEIGLFKIVSESAVAAGVRRVEAVTSIKAEEVVEEKELLINELKELLKQPKDLKKAVKGVMDENSMLRKKLEAVERDKAKDIKQGLINDLKEQNGVRFLAKKVQLDANAMKNLAFQLKSQYENLFLVMGSENEGKALLTIVISEPLAKEKALNAGNIIRELAREIKGGGGGQPFFATAGGNDPSGLDAALEKASNYLS